MCSTFPLDWTSVKVQLQVDETFTGLADQLNISDWKIKSATAEVKDVTIYALEQLRSSFVLTISAERFLGFYVWKIMVPMALIVFMSWSVFWIDSKQFSTQIGLSATSVLTMVAFIFSTTNMLPQLGYITVLDLYIVASTVFVFAALLVTLATGYLAWIGRFELCKRLDRISRMAFPLAFFVLGLAFYASAH